MGEPVEIRGRCDPRFERVREAFAQEFAAGNELGAALCVTVEGETVADLWGGHRDAARTLRWERDTLANVYSTTKGITAIALHRLVDEGKVDLDAPVARYWPEFARSGKERIPVRHLLSHEAGLAALRRPVGIDDLYDWDLVCDALAEQVPWWEPGERHGYHALTYGWLVGEVIRRVRGRSVGEVVREEIARPLGVEFEIGFGPELDARVAPLVPGPIHAAPDGRPAFDLVAALRAEPEGLLARVFANPPLLDAAHVNSRAWRAAEIPAANGHTNAHSLARIYAALANGGAVDGVRLLSPEAVERARREQVNGRDEVLPMPTRIGLGFFLSSDFEPLGPNPGAFGHAGAGGSLGVADPEHRLSLGYVMNRMHQGLWLVDPRPRRLLAAAYACL
jgi:CubicO group peptidase (beta-lactamase class C family)